MTKKRTPARTRRPATRPAAARTRSRGTRPRRRVVAQGGGVTVTEVGELDALRREIERLGRTSRARWDASPEDVRRSVAQLVLTLVEFIRQLLERQAIRRMEAGTLNTRQVEDIGQALMTLEETVVDMARQFGLTPEDLNLDLGPLGKLM